MRRLFFYLIMNLGPTVLAYSQGSLRVVVPSQPVVVGESFQVQYVLEGAEGVTGIQSPPFSRVRVVAGPVIYQGSANAKTGSQVRNFVYTLEARQPGTLFIPGATVQYGNKSLRSQDAFVRVLSREEARALEQDAAAASSDYLLLPGEDPQEKIRKNLFVKVQVDRQRCYPGQPVTAVFKLYSRLQSRSDIVKNPGFYGFTVFDMVNLNDRLVTTERINGRLFDVHTIRQVQLFPLRPGVFTIDELEVKNKVEFSRSGVNRKTEQAITEGVLKQEEERPLPPGTLVVENTLRTDPVTITVRPYPAETPPGFTGATGAFGLEVKLARDSLFRNEEGLLEVSISGKGNFTQIDRPVINWPAGLEVFDPEYIDELDRTQTPLSGRRVFRYRFTAAGPGLFKIPAINFVYFSPDSQRFVYLPGSPLQVKVSDKIKPGVHDAVRVPARQSAEAVNRLVSRIAAILVVLTVLAVCVYWITRKKKTNISPAEVSMQAPDVKTFFAPAVSYLPESGSSFYTVLYQCNWDYYSALLGLQGKGMDKQALFDATRARGADTEWLRSLEQLLERCEWHSYTGAGLEEEGEQLLEESLRLVRSFKA